MPAGAESPDEDTDQGNWTAEEEDDLPDLTMGFESLDDQKLAEIAQKKKVKRLLQPKKNDFSYVQSEDLIRSLTTKAKKGKSYRERKLNQIQTRLVKEKRFTQSVQEKFKEV